jgi:hypothetical protein
MRWGLGWGRGACWLLALVTLTSMATLSACGRAQAPPRAPMSLAVEATQQRVTQSAQRALDAAAGQPSYTVLVRYNPNRVDPTATSCAPFEAHFEGRWHRVIVQAPSDLTAELDLYMSQEKAAQPPALLFIGTPTNSAERCPDTRQWVQVFKLQQLEPWLGGEYP